MLKVQDLPKSNQVEEAWVRQVSKQPDNTPAAFDRRAIPAVAVESRWHAPDGFAIRRIDWPAPGGAKARGSILFLPGRGDFYEKYLETLAHWNARGWRVTAADWRWQAGSGRAGNDDVTGHVDDFSTWVGDLAALWAEWKVSTPGPHVMAAHSMGGHLSLRAAVEGRIDPDAVVLCAPMLGFLPDFMPPAVMHLAARLMKALGDPRRPAWKWSEKPGQPADSREGLLTHDAARYQDELWWRGQRPELAMGPGSWGWVERSYASMRVVFAPGGLEQVRVPVLLIATDNDKLVGFRPIMRAAARLPHGKLVRFGKEAHHEILREDDPVRDRALAAIDAFLDESAPARS